jgi:hypothetical protein
MQYIPCVPDYPKATGIMFRDFSPLLANQYDADTLKIQATIVHKSAHIGSG